MWFAGWAWNCACRRHRQMSRNLRTRSKKYSNCAATNPTFWTVSPTPIPSLPSYITGRWSTGNLCCYIRTTKRVRKRLRRYSLSTKRRPPPITLNLIFCANRQSTLIVLCLWCRSRTCTRTRKSTPRYTFSKGTLTTCALLNTKIISRPTNCLSFISKKYGKSPNYKTSDSKYLSETKAQETLGLPGPWPNSSFGTGNNMSTLTIITTPFRGWL